MVDKDIHHEHIPQCTRGFFWYILPCDMFSLCYHYQPVLVHLRPSDFGSHFEAEWAGQIQQGMTWGGHHVNPSSDMIPSGHRDLYIIEASLAPN